MYTTLKGTVWKYGDNIDTDVIIPARYLSTSVPEELAPHCMEDIDASFAGAVRKGDLMVAGSNFGCGSSREHAPLALLGCGVSCVVATSFARITLRSKGFMDDSDTGSPVSWTFLTASCATFVNSERRSAR